MYKRTPPQRRADSQRWHTGSLPRALNTLPHRKTALGQKHDIATQLHPHHI
jgi:hypothetical protein